MGALSSLVVEADQVFLSSMEEKWQVHLKQTKIKSILLPGFILLLLTGISIPIVFSGEKFGWMEFLPIFLTAFALKWIEFDIQELEARMGSEKLGRNLRMGLFASSILLFVISFFVNPWLSWGLAMGLAYIGNRWLQKSMMEKHSLVSWEKLIQLEGRRVAKLNRIINLFTDAPHTKNHAKRRKYLDCFVHIFSGTNNPYQYLYSRIFFRGNSYSGLFFRLTIIGFLVLMFASIPAASIFLSILFLYLTGFQILPLYFQLDEHILVHLYPQQRDKRFKGFRKVVMYLLLVESILFTVAVSLGAGLDTAIFSFLLNLIFIILFHSFYIGKRTKKRDN
ncbi:ABC transporter permease [Jeotgalibaca sp. MA1X17-3]|nr:ABC transporter permease [Jeotgalibaca sp. MA1X17-3]